LFILLADKVNPGFPLITWWWEVVLGGVPVDIASYIGAVVKVELGGVVP
jgi:hypothetical protein